VKGDARTPSCTNFRVACEQISRLSANPAAISASSRRASTIIAFAIENRRIVPYERMIAGPEDDRLILAVP
jgi:hypothetical protein